MKINVTRVFVFCLVVVFVVAATVPTPTQAQVTGLLAKVKERGKLLCGVNTQLPGFGFLDKTDNTFKGFDTDFCRVLAAGLFGDLSKVEFIPVPAAADRFPKLVSGDIDVLIRNTTFTFGRDTKEGGEFMPTTLYDGSSILVKTSTKYAKLEDFKDLQICAQKGTTNERVISEVMAAKSIKFTLGTYDTPDLLYEAFDKDRCDAATSDISQLASRKANSPNGANWRILELSLSKEPLGPAVKQGDTQWAEAVRWMIYATFILEEKGVTSKNVDEMVKTTTDPELKPLLGADEKSTLHENLGFDRKWAYNIAKLVGNYGEIFDRNLGKDSNIKLPRGLNNLYTNGGLLYAPPFR